uniref:Glyco_hydro_2_C domain-containing protein n=1 Tax=Steinernema glaseri TaxID=37863 RepID=A0A1I7YZ54_9BILA
MLCVRWDFQGVIYWEVLDSRAALFYSLLPIMNNWKKTHSKFHDLELFLSDHYAFQPMDNEIDGQQFNSDEEVKIWL